MNPVVRPTAIELSIALLRSSINDVPPEAKLFLIRIILIYGDQPVEDTVHQISRKVGLNQEAITTFRNMFLEKRILQAAPSYGRRRMGIGPADRGRFRRGFKVVPASLEVLLKNNGVGVTGEPGEVVRSAVHCLLHTGASPETGPDCPEGAKANGVDGKPGKRGGSTKGGKDRLSASNRLLLAVLWSLADECGVVRGVGKTKLADLAGMTEVQLDSQLGKLGRLNYVLCQAQGVSCRMMLGKAPGMVYLNMAHETFTGKLAVFVESWPRQISHNHGALLGMNLSWSKAQQLARSKKSLTHEKLYVVGYMLGSMDPGINGLWGDLAEEYQEWFLRQVGAIRPEAKEPEMAPKSGRGIYFLHRAFGGKMNIRVTMYLYHKVCEYGAWLLNGQDGLLPSPGAAVPIPDEGLRQQIERDLVTNVFRQDVARDEGDDVGNQAARALSLYFFTFAWQLALAIQEVIKEDKKAGHRFLVVPWGAPPSEVRVWLISDIPI